MNRFSIKKIYNELYIIKPHIRLEIRKRFFTNKIVNTLNNLSDETVGVPLVESFKAKLRNEIETELFASFED